MSNSDIVFIGSTPSAATHAAEVRAQLSQLGYAAAPLPQAHKARADAIRAARRVVILWTPEAAQDADIRLTAKRASAAGKLTCVQLGARAPKRPFAGAPVIMLPRGRTQSSTWRRLLDDHAPAAQPEPRLIAQASTEKSPMRTRTYPLQAITALLALGLIIGGALYTRDAAFKARADELAAQVQARAAQMMHDG